MLASKTPPTNVVPLDLNPRAAPESPAVGSKRKAGLQKDLEADEDRVVVCIPAHKLILRAKSSYMSTRLSTAIGDNTTAVIREHADSMKQLRAMEAVLEFMYTDLLPGHAERVGGVSLVSNSTYMQKLLLMLLVSCNQDMMYEACMTKAWVVTARPGCHSHVVKQL